MPGAYLWGWDATAEAWVPCVVNADGKLIINPAGFLENPPTEDLSTKAPTSEWAFDHDADASAHHAATVAGDLNHQDLANRSTDDHHTKYTDAESRAAINDILDSSGVITGNLDVNHKILNNTYRVSLMNSADDNYQSYVAVSSTSQTIRLLCWQIGSGYVLSRVQIYNGAAYKYVIDEGTFQTNLALFLEGSPTEDEDEKAPTSEWAFDHDADASAHHTKYTDAEALQAPSNNTLLLTTGTYVAQSVDGVAIVYLNSAGGDIQIDGLADGYAGQIIYFFRTSFANNIILIDNSVAGGTDELINTYTRGDETHAAGDFGGFIMHHLAGAWYVDRDIT